MPSLNQPFLELLTRQQSFLLTGHEHPDGDCLGAQVALYHLLRQLGKDVRICNPDSVSRIHDFLLRHTPIGAYEPGDELPACDVMVLLDCADLSRLGRMRDAAERCAGAVAVIDHHVGSEYGSADAFFVDAKAPATGVMVHSLYRQFGQPVSLAAAEGVFLSIVSDTGWFRYSNTTAAVFALTAELVEDGVDPSRVYDLIHRRNDADSVDLLAAGVGRSRIGLNGKFGYICLDRTQVERASRIGFDLDQLMEPLRSVDGIEVVALFKEAHDGGVKVSLRATRDIDVQVIARQLGGGGHRKAAGATLRSSLEDSCRAIEDRVQAALRGAENDGSMR